MILFYFKLTKPFFFNYYQHRRPSHRRTSVLSTFQSGRPSTQIGTLPGEPSQRSEPEEATGNDYSRNFCFFLWSPKSARYRMAPNHKISQIGRRSPAPLSFRTTFSSVPSPCSFRCPFPTGTWWSLTGRTPSSAPSGTASRSFRFTRPARPSPFCTPWRATIRSIRSGHCRRPRWRPWRPRGTRVPHFPWKLISRRTRRRRPRRTNRLHRPR